tara:strand:+ start:5856 stop:6083 length:228 start_codon:yes stop_codon:yes gene_type:complete
MRLSNTYLGMVGLGLFCLINAFLLINAKYVDASAVMFTFACIFLWVPQMFPDEEKYRERKYRGNDKRREQETGSN